MSRSGLAKSLRGAEHHKPVFDGCAVQVVEGDMPVRVV